MLCCSDSSNKTRAEERNEEVSCTERIMRPASRVGRRDEEWSGAEPEKSAQRMWMSAPEAPQIMERYFQRSNRIEAPCAIVG